MLLNIKKFIKKEIVTIIIMMGILLFVIYRKSIETFCRIDTSRICSINSKCVATEEDIEAGYNYAYKKICEKYGYKYIQYPEGFDCVHTEKTCNRESAYPSTDKKEYLEWTQNNECIKGLEEYRELCEPPLRYDTSTGKCYITEKSCESWGAEYTNGECKVPGGQKVGEAVVGTTAIRSMKMGFTC